MLCAGLLEDCLEVAMHGAGKKLWDPAATAWIGLNLWATTRCILPSSPLISAQRAWTNICAPVLVQDFRNPAPNLCAGSLCPEPKDGGDIRRR
jgi:hypothetical protein